MKLIYKCRREGKTTELIEEANKLKGYNLIVCLSQEMVKHICAIIREKKYHLPKPITHFQFMQTTRHGNIDNFLIDDVDLLLSKMSGGINIHTISINKPFERDSPEWKQEYHAEFKDENAK